MPFPKSQKKMHRFLSLWFCPIFYPDGAAGVLGQIIFIQTPEFSITDFFFLLKCKFSLDGLSEAAHASDISEVKVGTREFIYI